MMSDDSLNRRIHVVFHGLGFGCIGGAIFLQIIAFSSIIQQGYFKAVEPNPAILSFEIALTAFALIYFIYMYQKMIKSAKPKTRSVLNPTKQTP